MTLRCNCHSISFIMTSLRWNWKMKILHGWSDNERVVCSQIHYLTTVARNYAGLSVQFRLLLLQSDHIFDFTTIYLNFVRDCHWIIHNGKKIKIQFKSNPFSFRFERNKHLFLFMNTIRKHRFCSENMFSFCSLPFWVVLLQLVVAKFTFPRYQSGSTSGKSLPKMARTFEKRNWINSYNRDSILYNLKSIFACKNRADKPTKWF